MSALRRKRVDARLSVVELAEKAKVSRQTISALESGRVEDPNTETLIKLADALGCEPSEIDPVLNAAERAA